MNIEKTKMTQNELNISRDSVNDGEEKKLKEEFGIKREK